MVNAISHHCHPRSIHGQRHNNPETTQNNAITVSEEGFKGCQSGFKVKKRPFQAGNLTEKITRIYREPDREYDRELKLNTPKIGVNSD